MISKEIEGGEVLLGFQRGGREYWMYGLDPTEEEEDETCEVWALTMLRLPGVEGFGLLGAHRFVEGA